ncbi:MAG: methyl-accepting chemotaxis protein [Treponema sp.]|jgi:methyl-accepting chemotaxis protein|nr:methyl-accepting chemotaxis protein [Treponema sp.]
MKIGIKLVVIISIFNIIGIGLLAGVTLILSQREIVHLAEGQAENLARQGGEKIKEWLGGYMDTARTLAQVMEAYKDIPAEDRRGYFDLMLKQTITANPELLTVFSNWGPNLLDGMDADYVNSPGTDQTGQYIPIWGLGPEGPYVTPIVGFGWDLIIQTGLFREYVLDPYLYLLGDTNFLITTFGVPVRDNGEVVGYVGGSIELSTIQAIADEIKPFGDGFALVFSDVGIIAAHTDPSRLGKNMQESEGDTFGPFLGTMVDAIDKGTAVSFSYRPPHSKTVIQYYSMPFAVGRSTPPWTLVVGVSRSTIMAPLYRMIGICIIIGGLTIILMSVGVIFTARSISRPIAYTMTVLKDISDGDLTKEITVHSRDELGDLARYLNFTIDKIKELVLSIRKEVGILSQTGLELAGNITKTVISIDEINTNIHNITSQSEKQETSVKDTGEIMGEVAKNIETLNDQVQNQTNCVSQSSSAVEEMLANIRSVTQTLMSNEGNITGLAEASEIGRAGLQEVSGDIKEIARESAGLLEINSLMQNIASQTNLLSMNAAIEAAHAGEAGKGFAVVADEIRKLAESSAEQSKTISGVLKKIKDAIDKITRSTEGVLLKFEAISEGVRKVTNQETSVRSAMEEQGAGSKSILESISSLNEISGEVTESARTMGGRSQEVIKESGALKVITKEISEGMREMAAGVEQISTAVKRVDDISVENKKQIEVLIGQVSKFRVE